MGDDLMATKSGAAETSEEDLFKDPPPPEECPICLLTLPIMGTGQKYQACCGKLLCMGCIYAFQSKNNRRVCPMCDAPEPTAHAQAIKMIKKRVALDDTYAIHQLGHFYNDGSMGLPQASKKAVNLWLRAAELGLPRAHYSVGNAYCDGKGVEKNLAKAKNYWELSAVGGNVFARHKLGQLDCAVDMDRAMRHFMIAAAAGYDDSLRQIKEAFKCGHATKDDFAKALRAHKEAKDAMRTDERETVARLLAK